MTRTDLWPTDELDRAKTMWIAGRSAKQIGEVLHRTRNSVIGVAHRGHWMEHRPLTRLTQRPPRRHRAPSSQRKSMDGSHRADGAIAQGLRRLKEGFQHPKPARMPPERPMPPQCAPVTLLDRTSHQCCWVLGTPAGPASLMCGAPKELEPPYCSFHSDISRGQSGGPHDFKRFSTFRKFLPAITALDNISDTEDARP